MPHHLAQVNIARLKAAPGSPAVAEFMAGIDHINRLAEKSPGFVWRLDASHAVGGEGSGGDDRTFVNLSLWRTYEDLHTFTYRSPHGGFARRRNRWFEPGTGPTTALWWLPAGDIPNIDDATRRLALLRAGGASPAAFSVRVRFDPSGRRVTLPRRAQPSR